MDDVIPLDLLLACIPVALKSKTQVEDKLPLHFEILAREHLTSKSLSQREMFKHLHIIYLKQGFTLKFNQERLSNAGKVCFKRKIRRGGRGDQVS